MVHLSQFKKPLDRFESKFTEDSANGRVVSPGKINTYLNQLGKPNAELKQGMLEDFIDKADKYRDVISKTHANLGIASPLQPASLNLAKMTLDKSTAGSRTADYLVKKGLANATGSGLGALAGGAAGSIAGAPSIGALIGEHAMGPFFSRILDAVAGPIVRTATNSRGFKSAVDYGVAVTRGQTLMNNAAKNVFRAGADILPQYAMPSEKDNGRLNKQLKDIQNNPQSILANNTSDLGHYFPDHAGVMSAKLASVSQFLNAARPGMSKPNPMDTAQPPTTAQQSQYNKVLSMAQQPLSVLQSIKDGSLSAQDLKAYRMMHPAMYTAISQKLTEEMNNAISKGQEIPYKTKMGLSLFLGQAMDSTMTQQGIQAAQPKPPMAQPQTPMQPASNPKRSTKDLPKMPNMYKTATQAAEADRNTRSK